MICPSCNHEMAVDRVIPLKDEEGNEIGQQYIYVCTNAGHAGRAKCPLYGKAQTATGQQVPTSIKLKEPAFKEPEDGDAT